MTYRIRTATDFNLHTYSESCPGFGGGWGDEGDVFLFNGCVALGISGTSLHFSFYIYKSWLTMSVYYNVCEFNGATSINSFPIQ